MNRFKAEERRFQNQMFFRFLIPSLLTYFFLSLSNIVDSLVIGRRMQENGLAAISLTLPIYMAYNVLDVGLSAGGSITCARLLESGKIKEAVTHFNGLLTAALLLSAPFVLLGLFGTSLVTRLLGASPEQGQVYHLALGYAQILLCAAPLFFLNIILYECIRIDSDEMFASVGFIVGTVTDFVLNFVFVLKFQLGVCGAIMATVTGQSISILIYMLHFFRPNRFLRLSPQRPEWHALFRSFQIGFASSGKYAMQFIFLLAANQLLIRRYGAQGAAVFDLLLNVNYIVSSLFEGCVSAIQPLVSTFMGEQNRPAARNILRKSLAWGSALTGLMIAGGWMLAPHLCRLFGVTDAVSVQAGTTALRIFLPGVMIGGWNLLYGGYAQAGGYERWCFFMTLLRNILVLLPCMLVCSLFGSLAAFWWMYPATEVLSHLIWLCFIQLRRSTVLAETDHARILRTGLSDSNGDTDIGTLLAEVEAFCEKWDAGMKQVYYVMLSVEEICTAIRQNAFEKKGSSDNGAYIQITLVALENGTFELHLRDNARGYNPMGMITRQIHSADSTEGIEAIGILMVKQKAKHFFYRRYLGFNVLVVTV